MWIWSWDMNEPPRRVNYFLGMVLGVDDFRAGPSGGMPGGELTAYLTLPAGREISPGLAGYVVKPDCPSDCLGANAHSSNAEHRPSSANRRTHRSRHSRRLGAWYSTNTRTTAV